MLNHLLVAAVKSSLWALLSIINEHYLMLSGKVIEGLIYMAVYWGLGTKWVGSSDSNKFMWLPFLTNYLWKANCIHKFDFFCKHESTVCSCSLTTILGINQLCMFEVWLCQTTFVLISWNLSWTMGTIFMYYWLGNSEGQKMNYWL